VITGATQLTAVLGWPIAHSKSPQLLAAAFAATGLDAVMVPAAVEPAHFAAAVHGLAALGALGASVTAPHKLAAHALCDDLDDAARAIGAVNCLRFADGRIHGHNTDAGGFVDGLRDAGCDPRGATCVLLGAGGAARAVAHGLREAGAAQLQVVARRPADWVASLPWSDLPDALGHADLIVDCLPADNEAGAAEVLGRTSRAPTVASLVYHVCPALLARARSLGLPTVDGAGMLAHQAARAFTLWTGRPAPIEAMRSVLGTHSAT
jgi:shikimate dehydrogenase